MSWDTIYHELQQLIDLSYLLAAMLFIYALKALSSPTTARRGNLIGAVGMLVAIIFTLLHHDVLQFRWIIVGLVVGSAIGTYLALAVKMTAMPQMVALLNGFGGFASALVAMAEIYKPGHPGDAEFAITVALTVLIGWVTFTGSVLAFVKLQEWMPGRPIVFPFQKTLNLLLLLGILTLAVLLAIYTGQIWLVIPIGILAAVLGVLFVLPIGGADMPVVISLLNSYSGLAAAAAGFVLRNTGLIVSGALVGASGVILSKLMCDAMNRSLLNVLFGAFGQLKAGPGAAGGPAKTVRGYSPEDAAIVLSSARLVIVVPGYGLAVAQAQHAVKELADLLEKHGVTVKYAIHPVAGRMPGHMNILLAEADVPYEKLFEMDQINPEFEQADAALVIGANDVVNPSARTERSSPLYGMPILNADKARTVMVFKRSMNPGFAGVENPLFYNENTMMLFGDAKSTLTKLVSAVRNYSSA